MTGSGKGYNMYNVQEAEFWKQRVDRENLYATYRNVSGFVPSEAPSSARSTASRASSVTRNKIQNLEQMLMDERSKRQELEKKLQAILEGSNEQ
mmetsp:Transcript_23957/g.70586  ORF Transcript_23957/g.70586 Transcript_23957/m.70586 type:complete len:94 (-) Transcript_23957:464-745(-)